MPEIKLEKKLAVHRPRSFWQRLLRRGLILFVVTCLGLFVISMTSKKPENLGADLGRLAKCPASPNCVSTQALSIEQQLPPIVFAGSKASAIEKIKQTVREKFPRNRLVSESDDYLHFEFTSLIFRFVDDVEFLVDDTTGVIHFRSASRVGHSDLGANRRRMQKFIQEFNQ